MSRNEKWFSSLTFTLYTQIKVVSNAWLQGKAAVTTRYFSPKPFSFSTDWLKLSLYQSKVLSQGHDIVITL